MYKFPNEFLWGSGASAPQTEGAALIDGKSPSTWDKWFELNPELFNENQGPENTSNVYYEYKEDAKRMKEIGMNSYRTSIAWTRLLPDGKTLNPKAVEFYRNYFQSLIDNDVKPIINLFHFDMPWWLMEKGGWTSRESVDAFAYYAKVAFEQFGDLVWKWIAFNEPIVHVECSYIHGFHYPAEKDFKKAIQAMYNTVLATAKAVEEFRKSGLKTEIGTILNVTPAYAKSDNKEDVEAKDAFDNLNIRSFLDTAVHGYFPEGLIKIVKENNLMPEIHEEDMEIIKNNTVDFIGINYYQPARIMAPENKTVPANLPSDLYASYDWPDKKINPYRGWEIYPEALYDVAMMMKNDYNNIPWFVSENGMGVAEEERFLEDGEIQDDYRIEFMEDHLEQLHRGIKDGSNCFGYQTWTFVDCWSWLNGYRNRYGFYQIDLNNNYKRTMKKSGKWFKELSENNGFERKIK